jgi:hypothetical protein
VPHFSTAGQSIGLNVGAVSSRVTCGKELWRVMKAVVVNSAKKRNDKAWNGVEQILPGRIACQDNTDFFFRCCRNYPPRVCSLKGHSEQSLLFGSDGTSLRTHAPCQKRVVPKPQLLLSHETCLLIAL